MRRSLARKTLGCGLALGLAALVLVVVSSARSKSIPFSPSPTVKATIDSNTVFALDLYRQFKSRPGNLFFSPYSASTALAMVYGGARGQTETEMAKVMHFDSPQEQVHETFAQLRERMNAINNRWGVTLLTANACWHDENTRFSARYLDLLEDRYGAEAHHANFATAADRARVEINAWVDTHTKGKIQDVIPPNLLDQYTVMVLCNAIYFKGYWETQFEENRTRSAPFHVGPGQTKTVSMMEQKSSVKTAEIPKDNVGLLELPYTGRNVSMIILLPSAADGLEGLEDQLNAPILLGWLSELDRASMSETWVRLPRFKIRQHLDLAPDLKALGMSSLFNGSADLTGMSAGRPLFVSDVLHDAYVEVNETGTEAAAATEVHVRSIISNFTADHPFVFLIRDNGSGTILFLGRVVDPSK